MSALHQVKTWRLEDQDSWRQMETLGHSEARKQWPPICRRHFANALHSNGIFCAFIAIPLYFFLCKPVLIQIMSWCWIASMTPNRVIRPQWVKWYSGVNQRSCQLLRSDFTTWIRYLHPHDHGMWLLIDLLNKRLQWRHNWRERVSNHQPHDCLLNRLFSPRWKKTSKLRVTGLCAGNRWIPRTNGQWQGKCFHLMTSSRDT